MERKRFEFLLEAVQPVAHAQETIGNAAVAMRQKVRQPDGSFAHVPIVTGDTMRHGLREASTRALMACAKLDGQTLTEEALRLLFAGGMVTGSSGASVKLDEVRRLSELLPPLALLGGCAQNRVIPGRIEVDAAVLVCEETAHLLPSWVQDWLGERGVTPESCRAHVEQVQRVRMDPTLDPAKRALLTDGARAKVEGRLLASESASESGDAAAKDRQKSTMMPFTYERIVQGSLFYWSVTALITCPLDLDTLFVMVASFAQHMTVGGKRGTGNGLLRPVQGAARASDLSLNPEPARVLDLVGPDQRVGELFRRHVGDRSEEIRAFLETVAA